MNRESKLIIFVAVLASLLEIIDTSIVNVAIPTMMGNLGATVEDISMVITGYAIANAIVLPVSAWLGERLGRREYYLGCIIAFTATSVACGFAPNLTSLIVFRILQGLAGGALLPTSQTLIYEQFPPEKAGMAGAIFGMSVMIGPTLGPTLGGYLTDMFGWRSIFNVNLPLGILAFMVGFAVVKNVDHSGAPANAKKKSIDAFGLLLLCAAIGCLQYVLERGEVDDWFDSGLILTCSLISAISFPLFVWWELRIPNPVINLRLFRDGVVVNGTLLMGFVGFFLYGLIFLLPIFVGRTLNYDATQTGLLFIPGSMLTAMMMPFVGKAMQKVSSKALIFVGLFSVEICLYMFTKLSSLSGKNEILIALFIRGFAMAFLFVPINSSILSQFKGAALGQVSGLMNLCRQIGGSIGIALGGTLLTATSHQNYLDLASKVSLLEPQTVLALRSASGGLGSQMAKNLGSGLASDGALRAIFGRIQGQVFMMSFIQLMWVIALIFALAFIPLYFLKLRTRTASPVAAH